MEAKRSVVLALVVILAGGGWVVRQRSAQEPEPAGNEQRRAALEACPQRVEGFDVSVCVPAGWVPLTIGQDRKSEPVTTTDPVAYDGNAFNVELHDPSGELLARVLMIGPMDQGDADDTPSGKLVAQLAAPEPAIGAAFDSTDDPAAQAQAVVAAITAKDPVDPSSGRTPVALPAGTVPGAVTVANAPSLVPSSWNVVRGDRRYRISAVWNPASGTPADQAALDTAVAELLRTWTWTAH